MSDGLTLENACIRLNGQVLIEQSLHVPLASVTTIMGPSGSGKSSLLAWIGGFLEKDFEANGRIILAGEDVTNKPAHERRIGTLFQDPLLFPHMSVAENLLFAIPKSVKARKERLDLICMALKDVGLEGYDSRDPATLSGGQKARVALMRVLLSQPKALLLDEPFSKLDADRRGRVRSFVFEAAIARKLPVLLVTHDEEDAKAAGGEVIRLAEHEAL